jgi:hypothetical protein
MTIDAQKRSNLATFDDELHHRAHAVSVGVEPDSARSARRQLVENSRGVIVSRVSYYKNDQAIRLCELPGLLIQLGLCAHVLRRERRSNPFALAKEQGHNNCLGRMICCSH